MEVQLATCPFQKMIATCSSLRVWSYLKATRTCFEMVPGRGYDYESVILSFQDNSVVWIYNAQDTSPTRTRKKGILILSKNMRYMTVWQRHAPADERNKWATSCIERTSGSWKESALPVLQSNVMHFKKTSAQSTSARLSGTQHAHETVLMVLYFTRTYFPTCIVQPSKLRTAKSCQVYPWILKKWIRGQNHGTCEFSNYSTSRPKSCELLIQLYHAKLSAIF